MHLNSDFYLQQAGQAQEWAAKSQEPQRSEWRTAEQSYLLWALVAEIRALREKMGARPNF
jgi:hypothetical protein